jgi:hypothetical protein
MNQIMKVHESLKIKRHLLISVSVLSNHIYSPPPNDRSGE